MLTWDNLDSEKNSSSDDEQANICLMADINKKVEVKTYSKSNSSFCPSSDDEEDMPYDVILQNSHMIYLQCKKYKE